MRKMLAKFATSRAIGLSIGDHRVVLSQVAFTAMGPLEISRQSAEVGSQPIQNVVGNLLAAALGQDGWKNAPISIALPVLRVFFSTRPIRSANLNASPHMLLHEVVQSSNLVIDDLDVDMIKSQPGKQTVASIIATRKRYLAPILEGLENCGVRPHQVEPSPFGLLRAVFRRHRTPRGSRAALRVFLGPESGLAILTVSDLPLGWRYFGLTPGEEAKEVESVAASMLTLSKYYGVDHPPDTLLIHGRSDLSRLSEGVSRSLPSYRVLRFDWPNFESGDIAYCTALGCQNPENGFNLARSLRPRTSVVHVLPIAQMICLLGLLTAATMFLVARQHELKRQLDVLKVEEGGHAWMENAERGELEKQLKESKARAQAIRTYLESRVSWTEFLQESARLLPPDLNMTSFEGQTKSGTKKSTVTERTLTMGFRSPIHESGSIPGEVDSYLSALKKSESLSKTFDQVSLSTLRLGADPRSKERYVSFMIVSQSRSLKKPRGG